VLSPAYKIEDKRFPLLSIFIVDNDDRMNDLVRTAVRPARRS